MFPVRIVCLVLCLCCLVGLCGGALAAQVDADATYCFTAQDFSGEEEALRGICITGLPDPDTGTVMLGNRVLCKGDILSADSLEKMTFVPLRTQEDAQAQLTYLPIYENRVDTSAVVTISIRGKEDKAPVAGDSAIETYKNLSNEGKLDVSDPEGQPLTYTLQRSPKRGQVELRADGTFLYTPKKNKVGVDSFTYTAADPAGNVSREATVTIQILKPTDGRQYTDTADLDCRFEAEWMRNTGLFVGETISGEDCFQPEKPVSRGEFLAMVVKLLDVPVEDDQLTEVEAPMWLRPYLAAAIRSGLTAGLPEQTDMEQPVTGGEAAVMLQNALDLTVTDQALETAVTDDAAPQWAASSLTVMAQYGLTMEPEGSLTRGQVAKILYQVDDLAVNAPGVAVIRKQK